ncbi:hypothetical protein GGG16DRAFT_29147, partial [Schizophyllum commune]
VRNLLGILLGTERPDGVGLFGKVGAYYGVVEAQGRGTLHIHLLVWLKYGPNPMELKERLSNEPEFADRLLAWYDDIISRSVPDGTEPYDRSKTNYKRQPVMSRMLNPRDASFDDKFNQDLRDVLENAAQIHTHSGTCYKHLPSNLRSIRDDDKDCRFQLPRPVVEKSYIADDDEIVLQCNDGRVNGYSPLITSTQRCNTDVKPIGSGTMAMAMFQYVGSYTTKFSMDTAIVFSAICASMKALATQPPMDIDGNIDAEQRSRLLLVKSVNKLHGKRELSGQQVASNLLGLPSYYTNRAYPTFFWSGMLREISR